MRRLRRHRERAPGLDGQGLVDPRTRGGATGEARARGRSPDDDPAGAWRPARSVRRPAARLARVSRRTPSSKPRVARSSSSSRCSTRRRPRETSWRSRGRDSSTACRSIAWCRISSCRMATRAATAKADRATPFATSSTSGPTCAAPSGWRSAGRDTGGSQFFITHSPQPHLDARYTVFGHVINGMEVVDRIQVGDVIQRIRVWDGKTWYERVQQKRGRRPPPFLTGEAAYRFLPPFFFPPLAVFFAIALIPPFARGFLRGLSPRCGAAAVLARQPA